ncbi:uncharacterized protein LOC105897593 isoform X2 [Clupea harengus]|uniref:Uncharacterized protein LOC105897593 isoform X2 n=1 Tax=Clupea harengus TaxID=7950 RepID=A0A6P3VSB0_CLUHA|nr:uncharacterized protein LOC105897593 isoform X2 [Clupea harengus]
MATKDCAPWPDLDKTNTSPVIRHLVENMSEEQWKVVHEALCEPNSTVELGHLCSNIVKAVTQTTHHHLLPALSKVLGVPLRSLVESGMAKPSERSHWSQVSQYQTALCELFGITEDSLCKNLHGCLQQSQRDVVGLVCLHVNSVIDLALKQHILKDGRPAEFTVTESAIRAVKDLVCAVSTQVDTASANRTSSMTQVSSLEEGSVTNSGLVSVTRAVMNAITDHMNDCLDGEDLEKVGGVIFTVMERVNMLASQNASLESPICNSLPKLTQDQMLDNADWPSSLCIRSLQKLSTENFHAKATEAISEVLMRNSSCLPSRAASSLQNLHSIPKHNHLSASCHSIDQAAAVVETFIEEIKNIAQYAHYLTDADLLVSENRRSPETHSDYAASVSSDRSKAVAAAHMMFSKVQMKLMELYSWPALTEGSVSPTGAESISSLPPISQHQIDSITRDVVNEIMNIYYDEDEDQKCFAHMEDSFSQVSAEAHEFVDSIMTQLDNFTGATPAESIDSPPPSEQAFPEQVSSVSSKCSDISILNLQVITSERFFTEASRVVNDTLLKYVRSSTSFSSQVLDSDVSAFSEGNLPVTPQNVDLAAFDIIQSFVSEIKLCAASIEALASELQMGGDLLESGSSLPNIATGQPEKIPQHYLQKKILTSVTSIYNSMHDKVQQLFTLYEPLQKESSVSLVQQDHPFEQDKCAEELNAESSTKEIIRQISSLVKTAIGNLPKPACMKSSCASLKLGSFVDEVMSELKDMPACAYVTFLDILPANLHDSISLIEKLSDREFQTKASRQVSEVLLKSMISQSSLVNSEPREKATGDTDCNDVRSFFPSAPQSQSVAFDLVREAIEVTVERLITSGIYFLTQSTASDIVGSVTASMKDLLEVKLSSEALQLTKGDSAKVSQAYNARVIVDRICLTAHQIVTNIKKKMTECLHKHESFAHKDKREASARKAISQVLVSIQNELPDTEGAENSEQIKLVHDLLSTMTDEIESLDTQSDHRQMSSQSLQASESDISRPAPPDLLSSRRRPRQFLSQTSVREYSRSLADQIYQILRNSYDPLVLFMPAGKIVSDSCLSVVPCRDEEKHETPYDLIYSCVEESVKRLILSCFFPLTSRENQERILRHSFDSVSRSGSRNSPSVHLTHNMEASKSSPQVFRSTINVLTQVLAKEVMERLSFEVNETLPVESDNDTKTFRQLSAREEPEPPGKQMEATTPKTCLAVADMAVFETVMGFPLSPPESEEASSSDYACLVSMLVIRLLCRTSSSRHAIGNQQEGLRDDMLDMSRELIEKILSELFLASGITKCQNYPEDMKIFRIYENIYQDLVEEYGSVRGLRSAAESRDSSFDASLVKLLMKEVHQDPSTGSAPEVKGEKGTKNSTEKCMALPQNPIKKKQDCDVATTDTNTTFTTKLQGMLKGLKPFRSCPFRIPKVPKLMSTFKIPRNYNEIAPCWKLDCSKDIVPAEENLAFTTKLQGMLKGLKPFRSCPFRIPKVPKLRSTFKIPRKYNEIAPCWKLDCSKDIVPAEENLASS